MAQQDSQRPDEEAATPSGEATVPEAPTPPDVYALLRLALDLFIQQAWIDLGIVAPPGTSETRQNLDQARVSIDTIAFLLDKLRQVASAEEAREVELVLTNLRINFAQRVG